MTTAQTPAAPSDRAERFFVTATWILAAIGAFAYTAWFGRNLPYMDDWVLVPTLSGAQPFGAQWLFEQTLEHRYILGKALIYPLWQIGGGDFRSTLWVADALLATLAYACLHVARAVRGRSEFTDAFFPVIFLNWGNYETLLLFVQLWFVLPVALFTGAMLMILSGAWHRRRGMFTLCACVVLLPLNGAIGMLYAPPLVLWLAWTAWSNRDRRTVSGPLALAAVLAAGFSVLYLVGYRAPDGIERVPRTASGVIDAVLEVLSVSFGPGGASLWPWSGIAVAIFGAVGAAFCVYAVRDPGERARAAGLLACIAAAGLIPLGVGYGRSALGPGAGFPARYTLLIAPGLGACLFAASLYGGRVFGRLAPMTLFACACSMLALNARAGLVYGQGRAALADAFLDDLAGGASTRSLALRYTPRLYPHRDQLQRYLDMLEAAREGPYRDASPANEIAGTSACHPQPVPLRVLLEHEIEFDGSTGRSLGNDPYVVFALPGPLRVCGVTVSYSVDNGSAEASTQVFWKRAAAGEEFDPVRRNIMQTQATGEQTTTFWIDGTIDQLRFDPDTRRCRFSISEFTFLVPD